MQRLALLLALTATLHAQTPPPGDRHTDQLRFVLILSGPSARTSASLVPPSTSTGGCPLPGDIYLYSADERRSLMAAHAAAATLVDPCPPPPVFVASRASTESASAQTAAAQPSSLFSAGGSNLLAHILDTLQQAAGTPASPAAIVTPVAAAQLAASATETPSPTAAAVASPAHAEVRAEAAQPASLATTKPASETRINGAFGPAGTKLVYLSVPDESFAAVANLLGNLGNAPGLQLVFELLLKHHKKSDLFPPWLIRVSERSMTSGVDVNPTGCKRQNCDLPVFLHAARAKVDPTQITLDVPRTQPAP